MTDYVRPAMVDGTTKVEKAIVADNWFKGVEDHFNPRISVIRECDLNPEWPEYGAVAGEPDSTSKINAALDHCNGSGGRVRISPGKFFNCVTPLIVKNGTRLCIDGDLNVPAGAAPARVVYLKNGAGQGLDNAIEGYGRILCNGRATRGYTLDTQRHAYVGHIVVCDPVREAGEMINTNIGTLDCDTNLIEHVVLRKDSAAGVATYAKRFMTVDGSGTRITSDSTIRNNCWIGGADQESAPGAQDGGIGIEIIDGQRIKCEDNDFYSHQFVTAGGQSVGWTAGYKIRATHATRDCIRNEIKDPYVEATQSSGSPGAGWVFTGVWMVVEGDSSILYTKIDGWSMECNAAVTNRKLLVMDCLGTINGRIQYTDWINPRVYVADPLQVMLGKGGVGHRPGNVLNNYIETRTAGENITDNSGYVGTSTNTKVGKAPYAVDTSP